MFLNKINKAFLCITLAIFSFVYTQDVTISYGNVVLPTDSTSGSMVINMSNDTTIIGGFQFNVTGVTLDPTDIEAGDLSAAAGFLVSGGATGTVLGFSLQGNPIPAGSSGSIAILSFTNDALESCFEEVTFSTPGGDAIPASNIDVGSCVLVGEPTLGCTDMDACNYNADADTDDGTCTYPESELVDCNGDCVVAIDCAGTCGGDAVVDCNGDCDGGAIVDDCGVCGGGNDTGCAATLSLGSYNEATSSIDVLVTVGDTDLAGYQFNLSGLEGLADTDGDGDVDLIASGGLSGDAGFNVTIGDSDTGVATVIGFSLTGLAIEAGSSGVLTTITGVGTTTETCLSNATFSDGVGDAIDNYEIGGCVPLCDDVDMDLVCDDVDDCVGEYDQCDVCNGDGTTCLNIVYFGDVVESENGNTMDVWLSTVDDVGGFQFNVVGASLLEASGGVADAGFEVEINSSTVLGFSFSGLSIEAGTTTLLTTLSFDYDGYNACLEFGEGAIADVVGNNLLADVGPCVDFTGAMGGCNDMMACNYDDSANFNDGSCVYPEPNFNCDGDFIATKVQVIHNSADPTVDVYVDGVLAVAGFEYRQATPVLILPTSFEVGIAPAGEDVIATFPFTLAEGGEYVVVATGLLGNETTPFDLAASATMYETSTDDVVGVNVYHGSTDAPGVDIVVVADENTVLVPDLGYGEFSGYTEVAAADYNLGVAPTGGDPIAVFNADLSGLGGGTAIAFASGFLAPDDGQPAFSVLAALVDGTVLELPALVQDCEGVWGGASELDDCGVCNGNNEDQDVCGVCDGPGPSFECSDGTFACDISGCPTEISLGYGDMTMVDATTYSLPITYSSTEDIAGFQFTLTGPLVVAAAGGDAETAGFEVSSSEFGIVVGFSFTGGRIPAGAGILTNVWIQGIENESYACLTEVVISDDIGEAYDEVTVAADCADVSILSNIELPLDFSLSQNYPNPFNPVTNINFSVAESGEISLKVYDLSGKEVSELINAFYAPGNYSVKWDATDSYGNQLSSGVYIYQLNTKNGILSNRMVLMR